MIEVSRCKCAISGDFLRAGVCVIYGVITMVLLWYDKTDLLGIMLGMGFKSFVISTNKPRKVPSYPFMTKACLIASQTTIYIAKLFHNSISFASYTYPFYKNEVTVITAPQTPNMRPMNFGNSGAKMVSAELRVWIHYI